MSPRRATSLVLALALHLPACGGSSGSPSGGSPNPTAAPSGSGSANPCSAALAEQPAVAATSAAPGSKAGPLGYDDRDPREFVALHRLAGGGFAAAETAPPASWCSARNSRGSRSS